MKMPSYPLPQHQPPPEKRLWVALTILDSLNAEYDVTCLGREYKRIKINLDE